MTYSAKNRNTNRYMKLNGDPLFLPLVLGMWKNRDTQATTAVAAIATGASWYNGAGNEQLVGMGVDAVMAFTMLQLIERLLADRRIKQIFNKKANVCIDRKPNPFTPPTSPGDLLKAESIRSSALNTLKFVAFVTPLLYAKDFVKLFNAMSGVVPDNVMNTGMFGVALLTGWVTRELCTAHRFNKVAKKEWTIVDTPAQKKKEDVWYGKLFPKF